MNTVAVALSGIIAIIGCLVLIIWINFRKKKTPIITPKKEKIQSEMIKEENKSNGLRVCRNIVYVRQIVCKTAGITKETKRLVAFYTKKQKFSIRLSACIGFITLELLSIGDKLFIV